MSQRKLTMRADGRYKVNYGGKQFYGKTKAEALKKRDEYVASERIGLNHNLSEISFHDYGVNWVHTYRTECALPQQKQYIGMVEYVSDLLKQKQIGSITGTDMQMVSNTLSVYSVSYVNKFMTTMRGIFRTANAEGAILRNPMELVKRPKCKKTEGHRALEIWERELITSTYKEHDFGLVAMVMFYAGLCRGEALFIDVDRDVDFERKLITVRGAVSFAQGNQPEESEGKTKNACRTIPLVRPLADALRGHHGLLCTKQDGTLMSQSAFDRKYESYIAFLESKVNGCSKRWYGKLKAHKELIASGGELPPWKEVTFRCHDFRVDFCTRCYYARIPVKTLQSWMGHATAQLQLLLSRRKYSSQTIFCRFFEKKSLQKVFLILCICFPENTTGQMQFFPIWCLINILPIPLVGSHLIICYGIFLPATGIRGSFLAQCKSLWNFGFLT